jgi:hypothetical protein
MESRSHGPLGGAFRCHSNQEFSPTSGAEIACIEIVTIVGFVEPASITRRLQRKPLNHGKIAQHVGAQGALNASFKTPVQKASRATDV